MATSKFTVDGKPFQHANKEKVSQVLDTLPLGTLLTTSQLSVKAGVHPADWSLKHPDLEGRRHKHNNVMLWGSRKTIQKLQKELGAN